MGSHVRDEQADSVGGNHTNCRRKSNVEPGPARDLATSLLETGGMKLPRGSGGTLHHVSFVLRESSPVVNHQAAPLCLTFPHRVIHPNIGWSPFLRSSAQLLPTSPRPLMRRGAMLSSGQRRSPGVSLIRTHTCTSLAVCSSLCRWEHS